MLPIPQTFEHTLIKSRGWLDDTAVELGLSDVERAIRALRAGLHAIRDWLPETEAIALGAQLPMLVRGLFYEGWRAGGKRRHPRDREALYAVVRRQLGNETIPASVVLDAVIRVVMRHVSTGEIDHIIHVLPRPIAQLWFDAARV